MHHIASEFRALLPSAPPFRKRWLSLAAVACLAAGAAAQGSPSYNTGTLGSVADGTNAPSVTFAPGAVAAGGDQTAVYDGNGGTNTVVPFQSALNPGVASPFSVEFWAKPNGSDNDDAVVSNRRAGGVTDRSGWVFFQRNEATGWNFRMYSGVGSGLGWDLTGGNAPTTSWSHVVATWNGSAAQLYVNGSLVDDTNDPGASGVYNPNTSTANLLVASSDTGSPFNGAVDEVAFYPSLLSTGQIQSHYNTAASATAGAYQSLIKADGARLHLNNNVEPWRVADVNNDGHVTVGDLGILATNFNQSLAGGRSVGDCNLDGTVTVGDLGILATYFGQPDNLPGGLSFNSALAKFPELSGAGVPEPTVSLAFVGLLAGSMFRRRSARLM